MNIVVPLEKKDERKFFMCMQCAVLPHVYALTECCCIILRDINHGLWHHISTPDDGSQQFVSLESWIAHSFVAGSTHNTYMITF